METAAEAEINLIRGHIDDIVPKSEMKFTDVRGGLITPPSKPALLAEDVRAATSSPPPPFPFPPVGQSSR